MLWQLAVVALSLLSVALCRWLSGIQATADDRALLGAIQMRLGPLLQALPDLEGSQLFYRKFGREVLSTAFAPLRLDFQVLCLGQRKWLAYAYLAAFHLLFATLWVKSCFLGSSQDIKALAGLEILAARRVFLAKAGRRRGRAALNRSRLRTSRLQLAIQAKEICMPIQNATLSVEAPYRLSEGEWNEISACSDALFAACKQFEGKGADPGHFELLESVQRRLDHAVQMVENRMAGKDRGECPSCGATLLVLPDDPEGDAPSSDPPAASSSLSEADGLCAQCGHPRQPDGLRQGQPVA